MTQLASFHLIIDLPTLCAVTGFITVTGGLLLLLSWMQNRNLPALGLWGLGYLLGATGAALLALRGAVPEPWSICGAYMLLCTAYGVLWAGARSFEGRRVRIPYIFVGAAVWIGACQLPGFYADLQARTAVLSVILTVYVLLGAREVWHARDRELMSRWPMLMLLVVHACFLLGRIPIASQLVFAPGAAAAHPTLVFVMAFEALFVVFCVAFLRVSMAKERSELEQRKAALSDALTGVANRRAFFESGEALLERTLADRRPAALILFDLDRFKEVNDTAGHQAGDRVLQVFCDLVTVTLRPCDLFARIGGEEFALLLPDTAMAEAVQTAERIRRELAAMPFAGLPSAVTVSVGVAMASEAARGLLTVLASADRALYRAKTDGRNRVAPAPPVLVDTGGVETARQSMDLGSVDLGRAVALPTPMAG